MCIIYTQIHTYSVPYDICLVVDYRFDVPLGWYHLVTPIPPSDPESKQP